MRSSHRSVKAARSARTRLTIISAVAAFSLILGQAFVALAGTTSDPRSRDAGATSDTTIVSDGGRASASTKSGSTSISTRSSGGATKTAPSAAQASLNVDLDQWANDDGCPPGPDCWQNGDLNGNNSAYNEGDVVPFRLAIEGLDNSQSSTHTIHINYDFTAGGKEAYDFLATYSDSENPGLCDGNGGAISSMCPSLGSVDTNAFPSDSFAPGSPTDSGLTVAGAESFAGVSRNLTMYGGTITTITGPTHSGPVGNNSTGDFVVTFNSTDSAVLFAWGGHLAQSAYWKTTSNGPNGASQISGAPWHMRTQNLDGSGNKNQDRSIQPKALVGSPQLAIVKESSAPQVSAGDSFTYTITVTNTGDASASPVLISDDLDDSLTGVSASFDVDPGSAGGTGSCTVGAGNTISCPLSGTITLDQSNGTDSDEVVVTITATAPADSCPTLVNTATAQIGQGAPVSSNQVIVEVTGCALGLHFSKNGPSSVSQGGTVTYHVLVSNTGNADSDPVTVTDNVPLSNVFASYVLNNNGQPVACNPGNPVECDLGVLHPGDSVDITITGTASNDNTCPTLHNTATVFVGEGSEGTNTNTVDTTVTGCSTPPPPGSPALTITKTADATTVLAGSPIGFTITVNSTGLATATGVTLSDPLPSGAGISWSVAGGSGAGQCSITGNSLSCNFGDMGAGTSKSVHVTSPTTVDSCGTYDNTATVSSTNAGTHSASASVTVQCPAIQVVKSAHPDHGGPGDTITYRYVVTNIGSVDLFDISVHDDVLGHICDIPLLHPGESQTCTKDYVIPDNANISVKNVVVATGHDAEGNEVSDDDTVTIDVVLGKTITPTPPGGVAFTGSSGIVPLGGLALLLLLVGSGMLWMSRRRGEYDAGHKG